MTDHESFLYGRTILHHFYNIGTAGQLLNVINTNYIGAGSYRFHLAMDDPSGHVY